MSNFPANSLISGSRKDICLQIVLLIFNGTSDPAKCGLIINLMFSASSLKPAGLLVVCANSSTGIFGSMAVVSDGSETTIALSCACPSNPIVSG